MIGGLDLVAQLPDRTNWNQFICLTYLILSTSTTYPDNDISHMLIVISVEYRYVYKYKFFKETCTAKMVVPSMWITAVMVCGV